MLGISIDHSIERGTAFPQHSNAGNTMLLSDLLSASLLKSPMTYLESWESWESWGRSRPTHLDKVTEPIKMHSRVGWIRPLCTPPASRLGCN